MHYFKVQDNLQVKVDLIGPLNYWPITLVLIKRKMYESETNFYVFIIYWLYRKTAKPRNKVVIYNNFPIY